MGFITWIVNKRKEAPANNAQPQQRETAKQMYTREANTEDRNRNPLTPEIKAKAAQAVRGMHGQSEALLQAVKSPSPESGGSPSAHLQKQDGQEKAQAALSPTDGAKGKSGPEDQPKTPEKKPDPPRTLPRTPPSWER
jgi:hypothetical protein